VAAMKFATTRPYADPVRTQSDAGRNTAPASSSRSSAAGWVMHESGTYVKFTQDGAELFV
jgi:hypothetical protein